MVMAARNGDAIVDQCSMLENELCGAEEGVANAAKVTALPCAELDGLWDQ